MSEFMTPPERIAVMYRQNQVVVPVASDTDVVRSASKYMVGPGLDLLLNRTDKSTVRYAGFALIGLMYTASKPDKYELVPELSVRYTNCLDKLGDPRNTGQWPPTDSQQTGIWADYFILGPVIRRAVLRSVGSEERDDAGIEFGAYSAVCIPGRVLLEGMHVAKPELADEWSVSVNAIADYMTETYNLQPSIIDITG